MNLRIDSGLLNSHDHFGLNTKPESRFAYRRVTECAPLRMDGLSYTRVNTSGPLFSSQNASMDFMYGGLFSQSGEIYDNVTYQILLSPTYLNPSDVDYGLEFVSC